MLPQECAKNVLDDLVVVADRVAVLRIQLVFLQFFIVTRCLLLGFLLGRRKNDTGDIRLVDLSRLGDRAAGNSR